MSTKYKSIEKFNLASQTVHLLATLSKCCSLERDLKAGKNV